MRVPLIVEPKRRMFSPEAPTAAVSALTSPLGNQAVLLQATCQADPQGWQKNLLNKVIDACRAVPDAFVPADQQPD